MSLYHGPVEWPVYRRWQANADLVCPVSANMTVTPVTHLFTQNNNTHSGTRSMASAMV